MFQREEGSPHNSFRQPLHIASHEDEGSHTQVEGIRTTGPFRWFGSMGTIDVASIEEDGNEYDNDEEGISPVHHNGGTTLEAPNFGYYQLLIGSLILTTALAVAAGYDARSECIRQETNIWLNDFVDDDAENINNQVEDYNDSARNRSDCMKMFEYVVLPVGITTGVLGIIALFILRRHVHWLDTTSEHNSPSHFSILLQLLIPLFIIMLVWTYGIFAIMLKPKVNPTLYDQNPYKSLAAVDQMGHVGDNANLYYLSWISQAQIMTLVYHVLVECIRRFRRRDDEEEPEIGQVRSFSEQISVHEQIQTVLSFTSARRLASVYKMKRKKWYQFMYHLRERSGMWVAALFASTILLASSAYIFVQVLVTLAMSMNGDENFHFREVCTIVRGSEQISRQFCMRTTFAVITGVLASGLCLVALILHLLVRRRSAVDDDLDVSISVMVSSVFPAAMEPDTYRLQLGLEFLLSCCLSVLLGLNAVFSTGVQGPAATVGNLYYASWSSFLLCLRICLGCIEELYHLRLPLSEAELSPQGSTTDSTQVSVGRSEMSFDMTNYRKMAKKERQSRLRKYFFLSIFSAVCFASAWDAAYNQGSGYSRDDRYLIFAPAAVSIISVVAFLLCLKPEFYVIASNICFGGFLSILCFAVWLVDLIIVMHSEDSLAVNSIGEMKLANLYYFSCEFHGIFLMMVLLWSLSDSCFPPFLWLGAAILTAGMQMISYIKPLFGNESKDASVLVWAGMVKVSMVMLGASSHIWHNVRATCHMDDLQPEQRAFCVRTRGTMWLAGCSWVAGWTVILCRVLGCSISHKTRTRAEASLSIILVVSFGIAVSLVTSIGGPGQRVGDLYYSTWLAFWASVGIFISCYDQMTEQNRAETCLEEYQEEEEDMKYVNFSDDNDAVVAKDSSVPSDILDDSTN